MDMIVLILVSLAGFGLIKVWSMKPVDADGRTILTARDRAIGLGIALLGLMTIIFVKSDHFTNTSLATLLPIIVIGSTALGVFWWNSKKKR